MAVQARAGTSGLKLLTPEVVAKYRHDGYCFPIRVLSEAEARALRSRLETYEKNTGGPLQGSLRHKSHLLFTWLWDLVHHPKVLDAVEDVIGPNILCWSSSFFIKEARDPGYVSWHQDATYWGLSSPDVVTAWIAFSPSSIEAGAMRVLPGTQASQVGHRDTFDQHNMLTRGQEVMVDVDGKD